MTSSSPEPIQTASRWSVIGCLGVFAVGAVAVASVATRALLSKEASATMGALWFVGFMWAVAIALVGLTAYGAWQDGRWGRTTLHLDAPPRVGDWISGEVSVPQQLQGAEIRLHVKCIKTSPGVGNARLRTMPWRSTAVLDGARLHREGGRVLIPFAVRILDTAPPTTPGDRKRVDWLVQVDASMPGPDYAAEFTVPVLPNDPSLPSDSAPPRDMPELSPEQLSQRLTNVVETVGDATVIRLPFPTPSTTLLVLFSCVTLAMAVPGMPWPPPLDEQGARFGTGAAFAGLALVMLLILMWTTRRIEIRRESVRLVRGLFGMGVHSSIPRRDVVAVEEKVSEPDETPTFYGVELRTRKGTRHPATMRLRDPALAKALVKVIESRLMLAPRDAGPSPQD